MTFITQAPVADASTMTRLPQWLAEPTPAERPRIAWQIDASSGRPVARWIVLPRDRAAL